MSEIKVNKISTATGTDLDLGDSGDSIKVPSGGFLKVNNIDVVAVAPSTSGNVLTSNGSAWASTAAAGGGTWTESSSGTFGSGTQVATVDWTGFSGTTKILITNFEKSTSLAIRMRTSSDGGSSYDSASNSYSSSLYGIKGSSSSLYTDVRSNSVTSVQIDGADGAGGTNAADDVSFEIIIWNPADATKRTMFTWEYWASMNSSAYTDRCTGVAHRSTTAIVNGFQLHGNTGAFSGSYKIYTLN